MITQNDLEIIPLNNVTYDTWFTDLNGGRTEYVITIACMVGKSRMKGQKVVTNLVPYGPEKPRSGEWHKLPLYFIVQKHDRYSGVLTYLFPLHRHG